MTIQHLQYALTITDAGSMNKAAEKLFISQPALTNSVKELEQETGITIFLRSKKGVTLTNEGEEFLMYARQVCQQYDLLVERYSDASNIKQKFGVSTQHYSFAVSAFIETVKQFGTNEFEFEIRETRTKQVIEDTGIMKSEIGILYLSDYNRRILKKMLNEYALEFHPLVECEASVYLWKEHPLAKKKAITFDDLKDYPCLRFEQGEGGSGYYSEEILSEHEYPRIIKATDRAAMVALSKELLGYTLCSGIVNEEAYDDDFVTVPFQGDEEHPNSRMVIGYITKKRSILSTVGSVYVTELKRYLKEHSESILFKNEDTDVSITRE